MNGIHHSGRNCNFEKTHPGCSGRMVSLFELNIGVSPNRLLNDTHRDVSPLPRSRSDASRMSPSGAPMDERVIVSEFNNSFSNRKSNETPMKMLIAQEMSKEVDSRRDPPNLVAKLMGLDALPQQVPDSSAQGSHSRCHPRSHSDIPMSYWEKKDGFFHHIDSNESKDVCEIWQRSQRSPHVARHKETVNERKMALVRQKFIEAKHLSTDEKLRQSKQFQDALEVLSSNKDLFLKCLQEPDSLFSENLYSRQFDTHPQETKRITVLKPAKLADSNESAGAANKDGKQMKKGAFLQMSGLEKVHPENTPPASLKYHETPTQQTRIVILKPSPGRAHDTKAVGSPYSELRRVLHREDYFGDVEDDENQESREVAKAITQQMREKLGRHRRDETLISSVLSNGYVGDESSFSKSELEYAVGDLSDSEAMSPVSRHSWDYVNRFSPCSSYSPESSVCREAKKRLSERWAMMTSNGIYREKRNFQRSSSTLGEMLALSDTKMASTHGEECSSSQQPKNPDVLLISEQRGEESMDNSPRNLMRSKSVPASSTEFGTRLNIGISVSDKGKSESLKEDMKARSAKSSFKGKVSSLFFSRNKKPGKDKSLLFDTREEFYLFPGEFFTDRTESLSDKGSIHASPLLEPSSKASSSNLICEQGMISPETGIFVEKQIACGNPGENLDQPSPISVLDPPSEEDEHVAKVFTHYAKPDHQVVESRLNSAGSHLIDKSPPIGSIARSLSWDDSCINTAPSNTPKKSSTTQETDEEKQEWFFYVKALLSIAGLHGEVQSHSFLLRWHSPESPLDPSLRDKYIDSKDKKTLHDAKQRQKTPIQKLAFDCVNAALVDIEGYESLLGQRAVPCIGAKNAISESTSSTMLDEVWARMNVWFSGEDRDGSDDYGDNDSLVVERVVRKEVAGKGWSDQFKSETYNFGNEIEGKLLEELVQEVVVELELTGRV